MANTHQLRDARTTEHESAPRPELTMDEIIDLYRNEYVVMQITEEDEGWPAKGFVLTHAPRQMDALAALDELPPGWRKPGLPICSFLAQHDITGPGPEWDAFLEELRAMTRPPE